MTGCTCGEESIAGFHMTSLKFKLQNNLVPRVSHLTAFSLALGGKMRDPGNEVDYKTIDHVDILL